jgi:carbonic anhydrase
MKCKRALKKLKDGNKRFIKSTQINHDHGITLNESLVASQKPFAVVLTCSDSRVGPSEIFDTKLGDLFIIKNAGNINSISTLASIEFALVKLKVNLIVVLSHQNCGAVKYAKTHPETNLEKDKNIDFLLHQIRYVLSENKELSTKEITIKNAQHTKELMIDNSPIIAEKVNQEKTKIVTAYYKISTGKVTFY